jgi:hypothetical protein
MFGCLIFKDINNSSSLSFKNPTMVVMRWGCGLVHVIN